MLKTNRVLLVEDNDEIRAVFKEGLEHRGLEVVPAATVNQALSLIAGEKFDVLLSDLHLPDAGDGFTVVSAMRHTQPKCSNARHERLPRASRGHVCNSPAG